VTRAALYDTVCLLLAAPLLVLGLAGAADIATALFRRALPRSHRR